MNILFLIIGLAAGFAVAWFMAKSYFDHKADILPLQADLKVAEEKHQDALKKWEDMDSEIREERNKVIELTRQIATKDAEYVALNDKLTFQQKEVDELHKKFNDQFSNLANKILEEKSEKFTQQNKENIDSVLKPLNEKLKDFEKKV